MGIYGYINTLYGPYMDLIWVYMYPIKTLYDYIGVLMDPKWTLSGYIWVYLDPIWTL